MNLLSPNSRMCFAEWYRLRAKDSFAPHISHFRTNANPLIMAMWVGKRVGESEATFHIGADAVAALPEIVFREGGWYSEADLPMAQKAFQLAARGRHVCVARSYWSAAMGSIEILHLPVIDDEDRASTYVFSSITQLTTAEAPSPFGRLVMETLDLTSLIAFPSRAAD